MQQGILNQLESGGSTATLVSTPDRVGSGIFSPLAWREIARTLRFSGRQLEIVRGIFDDRKESNIADHLNMARGTVHSHMKRLHRKLGVVDRVDLVVRVMHEFLKLTASPDTTLPPICAGQIFGACPRRPAEAPLPG